MRKTAFFALVSATVLTVAAAMFVSKQRAAESEVAQSALFPGLAEHVNDMARIEVKSKDRHTTVHKDGEAWVIDDRGGYPALFDKVKATVVAVADLEVLEPKTTNKELYPRLGVEGIDAEPSSSVLVNLGDGQSKPLAALLVGKRRSGGADGAADKLRSSLAARSIEKVGVTTPVARGSRRALTPTSRSFASGKWTTRCPTALSCRRRKAAPRELSGESSNTPDRPRLRLPGLRRLNRRDTTDTGAGGCHQSTPYLTEFVESGSFQVVRAHDNPKLDIGLKCQKPRLC